MSSTEPELVTPELVHDDALGEPSFGAFMKGCRCPGCVAAHRKTSSRARKGKTTSSRTAKGPARPKRATQAKERVRTAVTDDSPLSAIGATATAHRGTSSAATESELEEFTAKVLIALTGIVALVLFRPFPELREDAAMTDEEADLIGREVARWFAGSSINKKHGARIIQSGGLLAAGVAVFEWGDRVAGALATARQIHAAPQHQPQPQTSGGPNVSSPAPGPFIPGSPDFTG